MKHRISFQDPQQTNSRGEFQTSSQNLGSEASTQVRAPVANYRCSLRIKWVLDSPQVGLPSLPVTQNESQVSDSEELSIICEELVFRGNSRKAALQLQKLLIILLGLGLLFPDQVII